MNLEQLASVIIPNSQPVIPAVLLNKIYKIVLCVSKISRLPQFKKIKVPLILPFNNFNC